MTCRHSNHSWLICGGLIEWCYRCGAFRKMKHLHETAVAPDGAWARPTGPDGENPWDDYARRDRAYGEKRKP